MNALTSIGAILLLALLAGHLVKFLRIPEVTGYILAGVALGPSGMGLITHDNLSGLQIFSEVALGLILFSIGSVFELERLRHVGWKVVYLALAESLLSAGLVAIAMLFFGLPVGPALLLGAIAMETAAASSLMVLRECNATGPISETLLGVIALDNIFCLVAFSLVAAGLRLGGHDGSIWVGLYHSLYPLVWQLVGSVALGYLIGLLLSTWASQVVEHGETLILSAGSVLLCVGVANLLDLSPLIATLAVGATMVNLSGKSRRLFQVLSQTDPPLYAIFFVIAGADLNLGRLLTLGAVGGAYVVLRAVGKVLGIRIATHRVTVEPAIRRYLGYTMLPQAGLAIGLVIVTRDSFPQIASTVATVVLAGVTVFELIGPVSTRLALVRSGEARPEEVTEPTL